MHLSLENDYDPLYPQCFDLFGYPVYVTCPGVSRHDEPTLDLSLNGDLFELEE